MRRTPQRPGPGLRRSLADRPLLRRVLYVGAGAFVFGYAVVALLMLVTAPRREVVTVPDVRRMRVPQAERVLRRGDLVLEVGDSLPNPQVPAGAVLAQSPLPGREVAPESRVRVILSTGPQRGKVPAVRALPRDQAIRVLTASGYRVEVREVQHARARGGVVGTEPAAGAAAPLTSVVRLLVSSGPPRVAVPSLIGRPESELPAALEAAGLKLGEVQYEFDITGVDGAVLSQRPQPGDSAAVGSRVSVVVATHRMPQPTEPEIR